MSKAMELADTISRIDTLTDYQRYAINLAAEELRRLAAVEASQAELLEVLQEIYETLAWDHLPPFKRDIADRARAAIAKATGETK